MGRAKDQFIEEYGGLQFGEAEGAVPSARIRMIHALTEELKTGRHTMEEVDAITEQILKLQGRPSIEWDTIPTDEIKSPTWAGWLLWGIGGLLLPTPVHLPHLLKDRYDNQKAGEITG